MKQSVYNSYDELPLMLSVREIAKVLGISKTSAYELVRRKGLPCSENRFKNGCSKRKVP